MCRHHDITASCAPRSTSRALRSPLVVGHRQVTDAYLLGLAMRLGSALVTLDRGLASIATAMQAERHLEWIGPASSAGVAHEPAARHRVTKSRAAKKRAR